MMHQDAAFIDDPLRQLNGETTAAAVSETADRKAHGDPDLVDVTGTVYEGWVRRTAER